MRTKSTLAHLDYRVELKFEEAANGTTYIQASGYIKG
jgi:hypothetical protein